MFAQHPTRTTETLASITITGIGNGSLVIAAFLQDVDDRILHVFDTKARLVASALQMFEHDSRQFISLRRIFDTDRVLRASNRLSNTNYIEGHQLAITFHHRCRSHASLILGRGLRQ